MLRVWFFLKEVVDEGKLVYGDRKGGLRLVGWG